MKPNTITITLIVFICMLLLLSPVNLISLKNKIKGGFQITAMNVVGSYYVTGTLQRADKSWNDKAKLDLNLYISNQNGQLVKGGKNFLGSCYNCILTATKSYSNLNCLCKNNNNNFVKTNLNLGLFITNTNGEFTFDPKI